MIQGKSKRRLLVLLFIVLQIVFLLVLAVSYYMVDLFGKNILLKTAPIDPRDLFYGDYVVLNYEISRIDYTDVEGWKLTNEDSVYQGNTLYVVLKQDEQDQDGEIFRLNKAYLEDPKIGPNEVMIKGTIGSTDGQHVWVKYGLEHYYVPEGTGQGVDQRSELLVRVKVAPWGQAKINGFEPEINQ